MGFYATTSLPEVAVLPRRRNIPPSKNRVRNFFSASRSRIGDFPSQLVETHRGKRSTPTKTVSGISLWLSRDPIGEEGFVIQSSILVSFTGELLAFPASDYLFLFNSPIESYDLLGLDGCNTTYTPQGAPIYKYTIPGRWRIGFEIAYSIYSAGMRPDKGGNTSYKPTCKCGCNKWQYKKDIKVYEQTYEGNEHCEYSQPCSRNPIVTDRTFPAIGTISEDDNKKIYMGQISFDIAMGWKDSQAMCSFKCAAACSNRRP